VRLQVQHDRTSRRALGYPSATPIVEKNWKRRGEIWRAYDEAFAALPLRAVPRSVAPQTRHAFHLYQVLVDEKALRRRARAHSSTA
jgi:dTDP-4-amino-4,6-dideoxygalactose transaminase